MRIEPREPMLATWTKGAVYHRVQERCELHRVTWAFMNVWRGSEFVRKTYFVLSKDWVSAARIIQTVECCCWYNFRARAHTHTHTRLCYIVHEEVCVCVNILLQPTGQKSGKVHTSHYTVRSESHCALIKVVVSDVHERLYRREPV
jgi:hypothetical protein